MRKPKFKKSLLIVAFLFIAALSALLPEGPAHAVGRFCDYYTGTDYCCGTSYSCINPDPTANAACSGTVVPNGVPCPY